MSGRMAWNVAIGLTLLVGCYQLGRSARAAPAMGGAIPMQPGQVGSDYALALEEALAIALRNSAVVRTLDAGGRVSIQAATTYDPAVANEQWQAALAAFDTSFAANFYWNRYNDPPNSFFGPGIPRDNRRDEGTFSTGLTKRWALGTETRLFYIPSPGYLYYPNGSSGFNPNHVAALELGARQPLLRGAGQAVNVGPLTIAQLKTDQSAWEFKQAMLEFVRSVEQAYWDLQAAREAQRAIASQMPLIDEVVRIEEANLAARRAVAADVAKARTQQHGLRQRLALSQAIVRESELKLRNILGLAPQDGRRLVPVTPPARALVVIDPAAAVARALDHQPDLIRQRLTIRIQELQLLVAKNQYLPRFDLQALYRANGLEEKLDDALEMMLNQDYTDWEFGAVFSMPLGRNADRANVRAAELQLMRERALLSEGVRSIVYQLSEIVVQIQALHDQYREAEARVREANEWLRGARIRYENPPPAGRQENWLLLALDDYLLAMRTAAEAAVEASSLVARYNTELARLEEVEGTLLSTAGVQLLNDPCSELAVHRLPRVELSDVGFSLESICWMTAPLPGAGADDAFSSMIPSPGDRTMRLPPPGGFEGPELIGPQLEEISRPRFEPIREPPIRRLPQPELGT